MANRSREELLALFPDIADTLRKVEERGVVVQSRPSAPKRTGYTKRVKGAAGYKSYKAVDWRALAANRKNYAKVDESAVVVSSGRSRPPRPKRRKVGK